jgi:predicted DNA-binding protein
MTIQNTLMSFRIPREMRAALEAIRERDGVPVSEQLRRALARWIEEKDIDYAGRPKTRRRPR